VFFVLNQASWSRRAQWTTSKSPAAPMPPPMHIVTCVRRGVGAARGN